ncbi:MAG TPA: GNAT family N-acetyltransferase [Anaerolineales bacterium]|nr:GNAT family N-acetyltransferase [Anaerolineales bacterium]
MFTQHKTILRDLGNGLIMRRSTPQDAQALAEFNGKIHGENEADTRRVAAWTHDLLARPHPTLKPNDFTIVEETATGRIVSSMNLIPQTWTYEGIDFGVGRPELVGTLPEYRNRGLVRAQFEVIHQWCAERGLVAQAITGIPYYYRLFGYEMALDLDGGRVGYEAGVPRLKDGEAETFCFRPAVEGDIPFIQEVYKTAASRNAIYAVRDEFIWRYELVGRSEENIARRYWEIIERNETHEPVGMLARWYHAGNYATLYELKADASWLEVTPSVVRYLWNIAKQLQVQDGRPRPNFGFFHGNNHPVYQLLYDDLPEFRKPYAYFMRVPDITGFIRHIAPALEQRLVSSIAPGYSGEMKISFYQRGLLLRFEQGKLTVNDWKPSPSEWGNVAFPELTFLQILFGYRSFAELHQSFADCWWQTETDRALIDILFPKRTSHVIPIG